MKRDVEDSLDRCLELLQEGRSIEQCLLLYPEIAEDLEPLLRVARDLRELPKVEPRPAALRAALLRVGAAMPRPADPQRDGRELVSVNRWRPWLRANTVRWAIAATVVLILTLGLGTASANSVPGDLLYPLKLATERVSFVLTTSPDRRAELRLSFADSRLEELVRTAQAEGRVDPALLERLLNEATLALEDARPASDERYRQLLTRVEVFNGYQREVFERLRPAMQLEDSQLLGRAISICDERDRWIRSKWSRYEASAEQQPEVGERRSLPDSSDDRCWDSGCRWK